MRVQRNQKSEIRESRDIRNQKSGISKKLEIRETRGIRNHKYQKSVISEIRNQQISETSVMRNGKSEKLEKEKKSEIREIN